jgi:hypothetical protein
MIGAVPACSTDVFTLLLYHSLYLDFQRSGCFTGGNWEILRWRSIAGCLLEKMSRVCLQLMACLISLRVQERKALSTFTAIVLQSPRTRCIECTKRVSGPLYLGALCTQYHYMYDMDKAPGNFESVGCGFESRLGHQTGWYVFENPLIQ